MSFSLFSAGSWTPRSALQYAGLAALTALSLAACGPNGSASSGGGAPAAGSTPAPTATGGAGGAGAGGTGGRQPGVSGLVAAVAGSTMQVQTRTDQTAVAWTDSTTFTKLATAGQSDVTVGSCVVVTEPQASGTATATPGAGTATAVTAGMVQIRAAVNGQCTGGFGGGPGAPAPSGTPGTGATTRTGAPTGAPDAGGFGRRGTAGLVTAVSGDTFTVQQTMRAPGNGTGTSTASPSATAGAQQTVTVTTTASTTYLAEKTAAASDIAVGECATALGKADDTGAVTATAISLRPATNGTCTTGFGGRGQGGAGTPSRTTGAANG